MSLPREKSKRSRPGFQVTWISHTHSIPTPKKREEETRQVAKEIPCSWIHGFIDSKRSFSALLQRSICLFFKWVSYSLRSIRDFAANKATDKVCGWSASFKGIPSYHVIIVDKVRT